MTRARKRGDRETARELRTQTAHLPSGTRRTPDTGGCATRGTPMTTSWGSSGRKPKPRRSRSSWRGSCGMNLRLELNPDKTLITHARTQRGAVPRLRDHRPALRHASHQRPQAANGTIALRVPPDVIKAKCAPYRQHGKPGTGPAPEPGRLRHRRGPTEPNTGASSTTTCLPRTSGGSTARLARRDVDAEDPGCAMRRAAISPAKRAEMRGDYLWI